MQALLVVFQKKSEQRTNATHTDVHSPSSSLRHRNIRQNGRIRLSRSIQIPIPLSTTLFIIITHITIRRFKTSSKRN
jgi:hypothetical protein